MNDEADWSPANAQGVRTRQIDVGARVTLRGKRQRRRFDADPGAVKVWPAEWRDLLRGWLVGDASRLRWATLQKRAGASRLEAAAGLCEALLHAGLVELDEKREAGRWAIVLLRFIDPETLREQLGLPNRNTLRLEWDRLMAQPLQTEALQVAALVLDGVSPALAIRRRQLLLALDRWAIGEREGTRREFAYFATGDTKGIADADWNWLEGTVELAAFRIAAHRPLLLLRAPLKLTGGAELDLAAVPDCIGLSPQTIAGLTAVAGDIGCWRLVENRTSFERVAEVFGDRDAVVWLPGYPPEWWCEAMTRLLVLKPADARIACDPDPAGIAIARIAGQLWPKAGLHWQPWHMDAGVLDRLPSLKPLSIEDRRMLVDLPTGDLPAQLAGLALAMLERGVKGEQEGLQLREVG